ncbi:MAG: protein kinase [Gordonia sp. (in: high G+C Gram-positive bacteria)]|uniref:serine/threonine-protein kinase n=1 Tax=Gordonia sp. (in: high G+C Gram-positive bacteria) TaxID=84139 RepID=UPI0039E654D9
MEQQEIAGHRVLRELGTGGMGSVYLVRHPRLPRQEALKLVDAELSTDQLYRARFAREADVLAQLDHPNIVHLYDRGEMDGRLWLTMEYVDGPDAATLLDEYGRLPLPLVTDIVSGVAAALDHAWATARLAHRDVKPANILIRQHPNSSPTVKLADFGVATGPDRTRLTQTGLAVGTLPYLAPESLQGDQVDDRCDQYSLACTAFHLLTGRPPFAQGSPATMMQAHLTETPPPPSASVPGLPPHVDAAIARAVAKDPRERFESSTAFANALKTPPPPVTPPASPSGGRTKPPTRALDHPLPPLGLGPASPPQTPQPVPEYDVATRSTPLPGQPLPGQPFPGQTPPGQPSPAAAQYGAPPPGSPPPAAFFGAPGSSASPASYGPPYGTPPPPPGSSSKTPDTGSRSGSGKKVALIAVAALVVLAILGTVGVLVFGGGSDDPGLTAASSSPESSASSAAAPPASSSTTTGTGSAKATLAALDGTWRGTYTCNQGKTALTLTFRDGGDRKTIATFQFGPTSENTEVPYGSYDMIGVRLTDDVVLTPFRWNERPGDYEMVGLVVDGPITEGIGELTGTVAYTGCTTFTVRR